MNVSPTPSERVAIPAADGYLLGGHVHRHAEASPDRPVVIVNPATSVRCDYYRRFADFLHGHGFDVLRYDYRGIGDSRPKSLRGFQAGWIEWGCLDFEAALNYATERFPGQPIQIVAHSVGGFLVGLAPSSHRIRRVFSMGAQFAYWRDYARSHRPGMLLKWHLIMPALSAVFGYFPGKRLGWLEDTPHGVVRDWTARHPRFEDAYSRLSERERAALLTGFSGLRGDTLAISTTDDEFGTIPAIHRLLDYFENSPQTHLRIAPADIGEREIGHFAFFHSRFRETLWRIPLAWLRDGYVPADSPGEFVRSPAKR